MTPEQRLAMVREMESAGYIVTPDQLGRVCRIRILDATGRQVEFAIHPSRFDIETAYAKWRTRSAERNAA